jgi:hypothetical protein
MHRMIKIHCDARLDHIVSGIKNSILPLARAHRVALATTVGALKQLPGRIGAFCFTYDSINPCVKNHYCARSDQIV